MTKRVVEEAVAPVSGEKWIADTKLPGFGLRIWRNRSGTVGRAFAIRVRDQQGRLTRENFDHAHELRLQFYVVDSPTLGDVAEVAREWAQERINILKGMPTLKEETAENRRRLSERLGRRTLKQAMEGYLRGRYGTGVSQPYLDRLDKLFHRFVPADIQSTTVSELGFADLLRAFEAKELSNGHQRILRPLLKDLLSFYQQLNWGQNPAQIAAEVTQSQSEGLVDSSGAALWERDDFVSFFRRLSAEETFWQQAKCLYIFLRSYNAPMTSALAARWDQFFELEVPGTVVGPAGTRIVWRWDSAHWWRFLTFYPSEFAFLQSAFNSGRGGDYLFPSSYGRNHTHIRSVDHFWRVILNEFDLQYVSPSRFRATYNSLRYPNSA